MILTCKAESFNYGKPRVENSRQRENRKMLNEAQKIINESKRVLFLTGAGISSESGIPTFRDQNGIWKKYHPLL